MPQTRSQVIASQIAKYDAQITSKEGAVLESAIAKLAIAQLVDAAFSGGGGGGGTSIQTVSDGIDQSIDINAIIAALGAINGKTMVQADIVAAIQAAADIDTVIARLEAIEGNTRMTTTPIAQIAVTLAAGATGQFTIPANARSVTISITSGSLVHYTEDGSVPTAANCWFAGGSKEIWDYAVPAGATIKLLAIAAATIAVQVRV